MRNAMRGHGAAAAADGDITMRAVEAGARLVAAPAAGMTAVLQMPRGNLEAICPRPLALEALADALDVSCPALSPPLPHICTMALASCRRCLPLLRSLDCIGTARPNCLIIMLIEAK